MSKHRQIFSFPTSHLKSKSIFLTKSGFSSFSISSTLIQHDFVPSRQYGNPAPDDHDDDGRRDPQASSREEKARAVFRSRPRHSSSSAAHWIGRHFTTTDTSSSIKTPVHVCSIESCETVPVQREDETLVARPAPGVDPVGPRFTKV